jgi:hypothetical protein
MAEPLNLPTSSRAAIEKAVRDALQKAITDTVSAARNTYTRRLDARNQNHWQRMLTYTDPQTKR